MAYPNRTSDIQGQGRPNLNLPYRSGNDRPKSLPYAPKSVNVTSPYLIGVIDIRWDNPAKYMENNSLEVLGVNVYRAYDAPSAAYTQLNVDGPVSVAYWRDETSKIRVDREDVLATLNPGSNPTGRWYFRTAFKNIIAPNKNDVDNSQVTIDDVLLEIDTGDGNGYRAVPPFKVDWEEGIVYLNTQRIYDPQLNTYLPPILPGTLTGGIRFTYTYLSNLISTDINRKIYYKVTSVAYDRDKNVEIETPMSEVEAVSPYDMGKIDWIWAEGIRRNHWLLEQTGERVKLFLRKWNGVRCKCYSDVYGHSQGAGTSKECHICYGSTYVGGYEGPYDILIAPPETEKAVNLLDVGLHVTYDWNTWTGPEPLLNDKDVIIRPNNDRYYVSRANYQGSRGATYQQHFNLAYIDKQDPVYRIPIDCGPIGIVPPGWNAYREEMPTAGSPIIPIKPGIEPGRVPIGRTVTFENLSS